MFKSDTRALFIQCLNSFSKGRITVLSNREAIQSERGREREIDRKGERDYSEFQSGDLDFWLINFFSILSILSFFLFLDKI